MLQAIRLTTEYLINPLGIDVCDPHFGWNLVGDSLRQSAYEIRAAASERDLKEEKLIWGSGKQETGSFTHIPYGKAVSSRERVYWQVRIWDEQNQVGEWSETAFFEMGLLVQEEWKAKWIAGDYDPQPDTRYPADEFRKKIFIPEFVSARLYMSACGVYEARLNGRKVGDQVLTPGSTTYEKRVHYQTYDITKLLKQGENIWDISLGDGWFRGKLGAFSASGVFGTTTAVIGQIEIVKMDGSREIYTTDDTFKWCNDGPVRFNDLKDGEIIDAAYSPSYQGKPRIVEWDAELCCSNNVAVKEKETFSPEIMNTPDGSTVLDFGQNMAGYMAFSIHGTRGHTVKMIMGEILDEDRNFTQKNLLEGTEKGPEGKDYSRFQTCIYTCGSDMREEWHPKFSIQGFRYVKLENWPEEVVPEHFQAIAVYSELEETGRFQCSNPMLEQLVKNTLWSMKGNYLDVPTDCPTRERAAWSGDAQLFFDASCYFMDVSAFIRKWIRDIYDDQAPDGKVYNIVPRVAPHEGMNAMVEGSSGWTDAGILIPYRYWKHYGDRRILESYYGSMKKLADFMVERMGRMTDEQTKKNLPDSVYRQYVVTEGFHFGEWNEPDSSMERLMEPKYEEATAYLIYSLRCFAEIAGVTGHVEDQAYYGDIAGKAAEAYRYYFVQDDRLCTDRMCKLVRPLALNLLDSSEKRKTQDALAAMVKAGGWHVGTGFLSTPFLLEVLSDGGYVEDAYRLLENEQYPGWLYEIKQGATTVWENWDGVASHNHYANGACCDWIFNTVCGIRIVGENSFRIAPLPGGSLLYAAFSYQTIYGVVESRWKRENGAISYTISVPVGCEAVISLPGEKDRHVAAGTYRYHSTKFE